MIANVFQLFRARLVDAFTYEDGREAMDPTAAATRWGWLPALSGVALGGEHARRSHTEAITGRPVRSG